MNRREENSSKSSAASWRAASFGYFLIRRPRIHLSTAFDRHWATCLLECAGARSRTSTTAHFLLVCESSSFSQSSSPMLTFSTVSRGLAQSFILLEDDVELKPGSLNEMSEAIAQQTNPDWFLIDLCPRVGFGFKVCLA